MMRDVYELKRGGKTIATVYHYDSGRVTIIFSNGDSSSYNNMDALKNVEMCPGDELSAIQMNSYIYEPYK